MATKATQDFVEKCKHLYQEADADKNGLTVGELRTLVCKCTNNPNMTDRMIAEIFADLDDDGDKKVTWEEFSDVCCKKDPKSVQEYQLREIFGKFDKDGSGCLTVDEIRQSFQEAGIKGDPEKNLANADKNNDGKINVEEFIAAWSAQ